MKQPRTLDEARALYPDDAFYIVAAAGAVNLEIVTAGGDMRDFEASSEAEAWALAFPGKTREVAELVDPPVWPPTEQMQREAAAASPADTGIPAPIGLFD